MNITIKILNTDQEIAATWPVMKELRTHLVEKDYTAAIAELRQLAGYRMVAAYVDGVPGAVAGFRISKSLAWGKYLYIDDLVTLPAQRSLGLGKYLMDYLLEHARQEGCERVDLDSGVQRFAAHRFYLRERMDIVYHHFSISL